MKTVFLTSLLAIGCLPCAWAQSPVYVCGSEYTNTLTDAQAKSRNCKLLSGGNVSVVQPYKPGPGAKAPSSGTGQRTDSTEQRAKDSDARLILESELKKAEARRAELQKEYNNGEPEKLGPETRNHQKYLDRVAELKANLERNESDIAGIRRELGRVPSGASTAAK